MGRLFNLDSPLMQGLNKLADLIILNLLAVICSIPVITIGASTVALYYATGNLQEDKGNLIKGFFQAFKSNFKQATLLWMILLATGLLLILALWFYLQAEISFGPILLCIVVLLLIIWCLTLSWTFPLQARFSNTIGGTLQNAFLCSLAFLPRSLCMAVLNLLPLIVFLLLPYWFLRLGFIWILGWFSLAVFLVLKLLKKPYSVIMSKNSEEN